VTNRQRPRPAGREMVTATKRIRCERRTCALAWAQGRSAARPERMSRWRRSIRWRVMRLDGRAVQATVATGRTPGGVTGVRTAGGVPGAPGTSWTGRVRLSFETAIENWPLEVRPYGASWLSSSSLGM